MKSKLVVMVGAAPGEAFILDEAKNFSIGRDTSNDLVVPEWVVSREHCIVKKESDGFWLHDLDSHNGTVVNDARVSKRRLFDGDRIRVGSWQLLFVIQQDEDVSAVYEVGFESSLATRSDIRLSLESADLGITCELGMLVKFGRALNQLKTPEELQHKLLEIILDVVPATRAAIVIVDNDMQTARSVCALDKDRTLDKEMQLSRTVTHQVLQDQVALLSNSLTDTNLAAAESLIKSRVCSLLCVPLSFGRMKGLLYLDSNNPDFRFKEEHLHQMTAIAGLIAAALANSRRVEELQREHERLQSEFILQTNMIGECQSICDVFRLIAKVAPTDSTIVLGGESGTGKELAARAIHQNSLRRDQAFVAINCAVLSAPLVESELFGHEKGSFTDAVTKNRVSLKWRTGVQFSWTKSRSCPSTCRRNYYASCRRTSFNASEASAPSRSMCGW